MAVSELPLARSRYVEGNFGPVADERDEDALEVIGAIPPELDGVFVRNGPNPQFAPRGTYHWFAGDGMLHAVELRDGRARYRNRYVRTEGYEREKSAGRALWRGDLGVPDFDNPEGPTRGNTGNTALAFHHGKLLALWEAGPPHEIALPSLETRGLHTFDGALHGAFTAHPKRDPRTGELLFFGYNLVAPPFVSYGEIQANGALSFVRELDGAGPTMIHDFVITERYAVIAAFPFPFELERAMRGEDPFVFHPEAPTRWIVIERGSPAAPVRVIESPACYAYHFANAYEEGDSIVVEGCRMPRASVDFDSEIGGDNAGVLYEWTLDLRAGLARERALDDQPSEFPRIHEGRVGQRARYVYAARVARERQLASEEQFATGWVRFDRARATKAEHAHGEGVFGGEGVFVPRPGAVDEGDGWLLGFVHDASRGESALHIVDCARFDQEPVARVRIGRRVPYGFHGLWVDRAAYAR